LAGFLVEGGTADWSTLYLRDLSHVNPGVAAAGYGGVMLAAMLTRFRADRLTARTSTVIVVRLGALLGAGGLALAVAFPALAGAATGFALGLAATSRRLLWIAEDMALVESGAIYGPGLDQFNRAPERLLTVATAHRRDLLWAMEEALKCEGLAAVVGEVREISFTQSRRLQLAVEQSKVTGFLLSNNPAGLKTTACVARWRITPLPSETEETMPGIGFTRWNVELLKVRNGSPGNWKMEWSGGKFTQVQKNIAKKILASHELHELKAG